MTELLPFLQRHFDKLQDRLVCFCEMGVQVESWFKGELLTLLSSLQEQNLVEHLDREVKTPGGKVDLTINTKSKQHWVELKHWLIGEQKGSTYDCGFYFGDCSPIGLVPDVDKLMSVTSPACLWLLILFTANPGKEGWLAGVDKFNRKFAPRRLISQSKPEFFPSSYFVGLLEVCRDNVQDVDRAQYDSTLKPSFSPFS